MRLSRIEGKKKPSGTKQFARDRNGKFSGSPGQTAGSSLWHWERVVDYLRALFVYFFFFMYDFSLLQGPTALV